jgi:hypothetical protein
MEKSLDQFLKDNAKYIKINDGESIEVEYQSYRVIADRFNPGEETIEWSFKYPEAEKSIPWTNKSKSVIEDMKKFKPGEFIRVTRTGEGPKTTYEIVSLSKNMDKVKAA